MLIKIQVPSKILPSKDLKALDINAKYYGISVLDLMLNAGKSVYEELTKRVDLKEKKVFVLCGSGYNGGDGLAFCKFCDEASITVFIKKDKLKEPCLTLLKEVENKNNVKIEDLEKALNTNFDDTIVIDALLGIGIKGIPREPYKSIIAKLNASKCYKVSIDVPSGMNPDSGKGFYVNADLVVCLHAAKQGVVRQGISYVIRNIGLEKIEHLTGPGDVFLALPKRFKEAHKGYFGKVAIIAGSKEYTGAGILASLAASKIADLVYLIGCREVKLASLNYPEIVCREVDIKDIESYKDILQRVDCILVGPGLGKKGQIVNDLLTEFKNKKFVIDADAIKFLELEKVSKNCILTPHSKEMEILYKEPPTDVKKKIDFLEEFSTKNSDVTVLLKGWKDIIVSGKRYKINETGNAGMTKGGTGDILAGLAAAFFAKTDAFYAACAAAFINGFAGDLAKKDLSFYFTARDLVDYISKALKEVEKYFKPA